VIHEKARRAHHPGNATTGRAPVHRGRRGQPVRPEQRPRGDAVPHRRQANTPRGNPRPDHPFHLGVYDRFDRLGTWAAESTATREFLGWFHFRPGPGGDITNIDLGYRLRRSTWNRGYATEGSRALISTGFTDLGVERVFGHTMTVNTASRRVMEKCGLMLVRTIPYEGADIIGGAEHGEVEYALTKPEWESRTAGDARN
jgi:RimJ/RimL family protein N-acetyltransferase